MLAGRINFQFDIFLLLADKSYLINEFSLLVNLSFQCLCSRPANALFYNITLFKSEFAISTLILNRLDFTIYFNNSSLKKQVVLSDITSVKKSFSICGKSGCLSSKDQLYNFFTETKKILYIT